MAALDTTLSDSWSAELKAMIRQLQRETILLILPAVAGLGLILLGTAAQFAQQPGVLVTAGMLLLLTTLVWLVKRWCYVAAAWVLVLGCVLADLLAVNRAGFPLTLPLLAVPVGLATLAISRKAGLAVASALTLLLWLAPEQLIPGDPGLRVVTALLMWSTLGMVWLLLRPLLTTTQWAWSGYESSQLALEQARDVQVELKQTLEDLNAANAQLTRLNKQAHALRLVAEEERRAKARFVANVSHELRTPLNMIIGFCEMITESPEAYGEDIPAPLLADLSVVLRNSQHLSSLIDDVLDLSQIDAGQAALTKERVALAEIVQAAATAVRPLFISKGLYLDIDVPEDLPALLCDRTRIREVVLNLLSNAGRYTEEGEVRVKSWQKGHEIITSVTDTGPGISQEAQTKLFQPFQQLSEAASRRRGGTGLGLSISAGFIELHGGSVWVESEPGQGAAFYFRLPIDPPVALERPALGRYNPDQQPEERARRPRRVAPGVGPRIVVTESGNAMQRILSRYLDGAEIESVGSLGEALDDLAQTPAQALLVNDMQVGQALERLSAANLPHGIPALVCAIPGAEQATGVLGVTGYLLKPIAREALWAELDRLRPVKTVLVVDDEPDALQLFGRMLEAAGRDYRVLRASNGREALDLLRWQRPDVVLLDLVMPEMDGYQLLDAMSRESALRDIPVVLISARDPLGQPIVSKALAVTMRDGLSVQQVLLCIKALSAILSQDGQAGDPAPPAASAG
jgi:signal transduction histidine kinase/CheY-like chemotaxis protein